MNYAVVYLLQQLPTIPVGDVNRRMEHMATLVVYAENGQRADHCDHMHGGNSVDLFAIQWLLRQPAPRVYVGDGEFCGGPDGQDSAAAALLAGAVANGKVKWIQSITELGC